MTESLVTVEGHLVKFSVDLNINFRSEGVSWWSGTIYGIHLPLNEEVDVVTECPLGTWRGRIRPFGHSTDWVAFQNNSARKDITHFQGVGGLELLPVTGVLDIPKDFPALTDEEMERIRDRFKGAQWKGGGGPVTFRPPDEE